MCKIGVIKMATGMLKKIFEDHWDGFTTKYKNVEKDVIL